MILALQLKELREKARMSFADAAEVLGVSESTVRRMENPQGGKRFRVADVEMLLRTYGVTDDRQIETIVGLARESSKRGWWHAYRDVTPDWFSAYLSLEEAASVIRAYEAEFIPGLLQTEDYARALLRSGTPHASATDIERRVALRMERQHLLTRPHAPRLWVVMDETVLRWPVGGAHVMRAQIDRLLEAVALPNVTAQIMRFGWGPHPAMRAGSFHMFRFRNTELPDIVYSSNLAGAVYLDKPDDVSEYREVLNRLCAQAALPENTEAVLGEIRKEI